MAMRGDSAVDLVRGVPDLPIGRRQGLAVAWALFAVFVGVDATTSSQVNLFPLFLAPVLLATWYAGAGWGGAMSLAAVAASTLIGATAGHHYTSEAYFYVAMGSRLLSFLVFLWVVQIAARLRAAIVLERGRALTDFLTGIANRAAFYEALAAEITRQERYRRAFALVSMDIDDFKGVNDRQGHAAGDALLRGVAQALSAGVRKTDLAARLGGDEFMVLLPETDLAQSSSLVEHLRASLAAAMRAGGWPVTFSIGLAVFDDTPASADAAVEFADRLMYRAKRAGKDRTAQETFRAANGRDAAARPDRP